MFELELFEISKINALRFIHLFTCLIGALFLIFIWYGERKNNKKSEQNWGVVLISFALLLWAAMDTYRLLGIMAAGQVSLIIKTFSVYNNAFFIASLPFFRHSFTTVKQKFPLFSNKSNWIVAVLLSNVAIVMFYSLSWGQESDHSNTVKYFDVIYSIVTFALLGYATFKAFQNKGGIKKPFMVASVIITAMLIIPQLAFLPFFTIKYFDLISLILLISQFALVLLLLVLAKDWATDEWTEILKKDKMFLREELDLSHKMVFELKGMLENKINEIQDLQSKLSESKIQFSDLEKNSKLNATVKDLSERELEVLKKINKSYNEIGEDLFIARETVITHKKNIEAKLGISGKESLTEFAKQHQLLESD